MDISARFLVACRVKYKANKWFSWQISLAITVCAKQFVFGHDQDMKKNQPLTLDV